jgi:dephospho-CoA kinase
MPKQKKNKIVIGVTGSLASGKSTVARMFKTRVCQLIDADRLAHQSLSRGGSVYKKIISFFGKGILKKNKNIDRGKLARIVFVNRLALEKLNSFVHPAVIKEISRRILNSKKKIVILDAPLIIEAGLRPMLDKLVVVTVKKSQQFSRARKSLALSEKQTGMRIKSQISQKGKSRFANFIIDNSGTMRKTRKQVSEIRRLLWKR